jgi:hypothetical protein
MEVGVSGQDISDLTERVTPCGGAGSGAGRQRQMHSVAGVTTMRGSEAGRNRSPGLGTGAGLEGSAALADDSLRDELVAIDGVAEAEVDDSTDAPAGVRVRLDSDADARLVGMEVQRVLAAHGLRSRITSGEGEESVSTPPVPPTIPPPPPIPPPLVVPGGAGPVKHPSPVAAGLVSVGVEESAAGVSVRVTGGDGRTETRASGPSDGEVSEAVVEAVAALAGFGTMRVVSITVAPANGSEVVTVVVAREDESKAAGAAVVEATRAWAVGRATWAALRD